jgi:hypothetical protein
VDGDGQITTGEVEQIDGAVGIAKEKKEYLFILFNSL